MFIPYWLIFIIQTKFKNLLFFSKQILFENYEKKFRHKKNLNKFLKFFFKILLN